MKIFDQESMITNVQEEKEKVEEEFVVEVMKQASKLEEGKNKGWSRR